MDTNAHECLPRFPFVLIRVHSWFVFRLAAGHCAGAVRLLKPFSTHDAAPHQME
jgi:hypothetical protein